MTPTYQDTRKLMAAFPTSHSSVMRGILRDTFRTESKELSVRPRMFFYIEMLDPRAAAEARHFRPETVSTLLGCCLYPIREGGVGIDLGVQVGGSVGCNGISDSDHKLLKGVVAVTQINTGSQPWARNTEEER